MFFAVPKKICRYQIFKKSEKKTLAEAILPSLVYSAYTIGMVKSTGPYLRGGFGFNPPPPYVLFC